MQNTSWSVRDTNTGLSLHFTIADIHTVAYSTALEIGSETMLGFKLFLNFQPAISTLRHVAE